MRLLVTIGILSAVCFHNLDRNNSAFALISSNVKPAHLSTQSRIIPRTSFSHKSSSHLKSSMDDDINRQLAKAKELLEKAKDKMAQNQQQLQEEAAALKKSKITPDTIVDKKTSVIKSRNEDTGLIRCDGEVMAALSEEEEWELKGIFDVFEDEVEQSDVSNQLAERDVAASIYNLRLSLQNEDYRKIFDKRNRWIGDE